MPAVTAVVPVPSLDQRDHKTGCPAGRVEQDEVRGPKGEEFIRTRCIDCGGQQVARKDQ